MSGPFASWPTNCSRCFPNRSYNAFYDELEWLHEHDPAAVAALEEWRKRGKTPKFPDGLELLAALKDYEPLRRPEANPSHQADAWRIHKKLRAGVVPSAIRRLLEAGQADKAEELALRFLHLATDVTDHPSRMYANHMIHRLDRARKAIGRPVGPDDL